MADHKVILVSSKALGAILIRLLELGDILL